MVETHSRLKHNFYVPAIIFSFLFLFVVLFFARSFDDNRTTSWQDVFSIVVPSTVFCLLAVCLLLAWLLSRLPLEERYPSFLLFASSFAISALFWNEPEVIVDASRYFTQAKHLELYGAGFFVREWGRSIAAWTDMPVVPFLYGLIFKVFGESRLNIQIFTALLFSLSVVLTYKVGKRLWDSDTGFYAGVLLLGIPYLYCQVPLMLVDVPCMFFLLLAISSFLSAIEKGNALRILLSALSSTLAFYSKYSMCMMLSVLILIAFTYRASLPGLKPSVYLSRVVAIFLTTAIFIGWIFVFKYDVISDQIKLLMTYQGPGLRRWGESFLSTFFFQMHPVIALAAVYSLFEAWRKKDNRYLAVVWLVALVLLFQIRRIRYIIMVFPMLTLMASYGLQRIRQKQLIRLIVFSAVAFSFVLGLFAYLPFLQRNSALNIESAGRYLDSLAIAEAEVYTVSLENSVVNLAVAVPILDLFTKKKLIYNYREKKLSDEEISRSPFRFTWEYKNPSYYEPTGKTVTEQDAIVVISDGVVTRLPEYIKKEIAEYRNSISFERTDFIYQYQSVVTVYYNAASGH